MDIKVAKRRKKYVFVPSPTAAWTLETRVPHPTNGTSVYGIFPQVLKAGVQLFEGGDIVLRYGRHAGNAFSKNGFGFRHIWIRRFPNIADEKTAMDAVQQLVSRIIGPGAAI